MNPGRRGLVLAQGIPRPAWGVIVIGLSLIAAVVVPAAFGVGARIAGQSIRGPIPAPPGVGSCLLSPVDPAGSALQFMIGSIGSARLGPCAGADGSNAGEIVSVTSDRRTFPRSGATATASPDPRACVSAAADYLGWPDATWSPAAARTIVLLGPDAIQYTFGQQWLACAIIPTETGYHGSLGDRTDRSAADAYGQCRLLGPGAPAPIPCRQPHDIELVAAAVGDQAEDKDLMPSCLALLSAVTGLRDPTASGRLQVVTESDRMLGRRTCGVRVVGSGRLQHSLLNWSDEPLPWSS